MDDLDRLTEAELDRLPLGVVQIDAGGVVCLANRTYAELAGEPAAALVGRSYFRDLYPAADQPAFRGRLLDGLRAGRVDERFAWVFGGVCPARATVHMRSAAEPGRVWLTFADVQPFSPPRREARQTVERRSRAEPVNPDLCEREPIHVPGTIQPHATVLAASRDLVVRACSENVADALGLPPEQVLERGLAELLPADLVQAIAAALATDALRGGNPLQRAAELGTPPHRHLVGVHLHADRVIVEMERLATHPEEFGAANPVLVQAAITRLRGAATLEAVAEAAAEEVRGLSGFERVLVYRFDAEWNGEAVAESRAPDWDHSLLGLRFPASDIPAQARALYTRAPGRFVVDRDAVPAALLAARENEPVDLTYAGARALSPIHLEYQRNLGVNGSMSASLLVEGRLWGLVIGHHRRPHYLAPETRAALATLADVLALRVHEIETGALWREQQRHLDVQVRLLEQMAGADSVEEALAGGSGEDGTRAGLLDLFGATGAAYVSGEAVTAYGATPTPESVRALAGWLRGESPGARSVAVDHLRERYAPAEGYRALASGVLAAFVDADRRRLLLWFRPEITGQVSWGGDPRKSVVADPESRAILPRRSFERWVEQRSGAAEPWAGWQVSVAERLGAGIEGVVLRQSRRVAELSHKQEELVAALADKERLLAQKDVLTREIDHRVKNSLQIVAAFLSMQGRTIRDPAAAQAFADTYARVMSVARVHDSLYQSETIEEVDLGQTIETLCNDLAGMAGEGERLAFSTEPGLMVPYRTAVGLSLIATELVTNAFKYARSGEGPVSVRLVPHEAGGVCLTVADRGPGLPENWANRPRRGLGMRLIQAMLDQIGARMTVANEGGARFTICTGA